MSNRVQQILDDLAAQAQRSGFSGYEDPGSNSYEAAAFEAFLKSTGMPAFTAKVTAEQAARKPAMAAQIREAMNASTGQGVGAMMPSQPGNIIAAATFNISVKRLSANIAEDLPFVLFGDQDYQNGYRNIIGAQIPLGAGTVLTSVTGGEVQALPNAVRFTYTNGANVDIVEVTCSTYPYPSFLYSTGDNLLRLSKIREKLSDATQTRQFDMDILTVANSPFGKATSNKISPSSFISPDQFQAGIVDVDAVFNVDKETGLASKILNVTNLTVNFSVFVEKFYRPVAKNW